jgi:hypothetical protein
MTRGSRLATTLRRAVLANLVVATISCASATGGSGSADTNPNVLTAAEIARGAASQGTAYEAVQRLRPHFLQTRGHPESAASDPSVLISVDGASLTRVEALQTISATKVREIRYLNASEAVERFGLLAKSGPVILVLQR